jgi:hypothetical protein
MIRIRRLHKVGHWKTPAVQHHFARHPVRFRIPATIGFPNGTMTRGRPKSVYPFFSLLNRIPV